MTAEQDRDVTAQKRSPFELAAIVKSQVLENTRGLLSLWSSLPAVACHDRGSNTIIAPYRPARQQESGFVGKSDD